MSSKIEKTFIGARTDKRIKTATHLQEELKYFVLDIFKMCDKFRLANCFTNVLGFFFNGS